METDYSSLTEKDFEQVVRDYCAYEIKNPRISETDSQVSTEGWGDFRIGDLLDRFEVGRAHAGMLDDGDDCLYLGAKKDDNCCFAQLDFANASVVVSEVGSYNRSRKAVANGVVSQVRRFLKAGAAVEEHLADQLLVPLAVLLGRHGGSPEELGMTIEKETLHYTTNRDVIGRFLC